MPIFTVNVSWEMHGSFEVEADTPEEAKRIVETGEKPYDGLPEGEYVSDSFRVTGTDQ